MISMLGIFAAEVATGEDAVEQFGLFAVRGGAGKGLSGGSSTSGAASFAGFTAKRSIGQVCATTGSASTHAAATRAVAAGASDAPPPFNPAEQVGAMAPLGFIDPLSFTKEGGEEGFRKLRAAELKHGRVAMMASIGAVVQRFVKFPFAESARGTFTAVFSEDAMLGLPLLLLTAAVLEGAWREDASREPGNFGDPVGLNMYTEDMRSKELNNGRMAMISMLGIFAAEVATGKDAVEQFGLFAVRGGAGKGLSSSNSKSSAASFAGFTAKRSIGQVCATPGSALIG